MFDLLRTHDAIAWDLDETLINSRASKKLHAFIRQNPQIRHSIVTFRTHGAQDEVWTDLSVYRAAPGKPMFANLHYPTDQEYAEYALNQKARRDGKLTGDLTEPELHYLEWKGMVCYQFGYTALVDDLTTKVKQGCDKYGISLFHPLKLK